MKELKYKVGDRVLATDNIGINSEPAPGTIVKINATYRRPYGVEYDKYPKACLWSTVHGYYKPKKKQPVIVMKKQPVIVITSDGKTTTATKRLDKKVICTATARCSDDDTFDFNTGAELAFKRLRDKEKPVPKETPWPKKLVCVESLVESLTVGRIYPVINGSRNYGEIKADFGSWGIRRHSDTDFRINNFPNGARFIPLMED